MPHGDVNPVNGEIEEKHLWLVSHHGPVFGSAWRHNGSRRRIRDVGALKIEGAWRDP